MTFNQSDDSSAGSPYNALEFAVQRILAKCNTASLVKVVSCTSNGGLAIAGSLCVQPLVNMVDGAGVATPHGIVNNLLYFRMQGGANAVIMDPVINDIGFAVFCSRDITSVRATGAQANPGSFRKFDWADGIYIGGVLNGVPTQYVQFGPAGISIVSPTAIMLQAPTIAINGNVSTEGSLTNNGVNVGSSHVHGGVQAGGSNTSGPH